MAKKVTISMVAERAGVSRGTVDRVLNHRPHVKPELYDRVIAAMKELDYVPLRQHQTLENLIEPPEQSKTEDKEGPAVKKIPQLTGNPSADLFAGNTFSRNKTSESRFKLGVLVHNESGYFKSEILRGVQDAKAELRDASIEVCLEECETAMPDEAVERLENMVKKGVQAISVCFMDHPVIVNEINKLIDSGIPVITFNSDLSNCKRLTFIGQDLIRSGRVAGELMAKCCRPEDHLLICIGNQQFSAHRTRLQGFHDRVLEKGYSEDNLIITETYNDYTLTYQKVREKLLENPQIKGIYMANHSVTGCVQAVRDLGMQKQLRIISHDLTYATLRLLEDEDIDFSISQNIYMQGFQPLIMLAEYLETGKLPEYENDRTAIEILCCEHLN